MKMAGEERDKSCVRVFLSVDLVGSTAFKDMAERASRDPKKREGKVRGGPPWASLFFNFYTNFVRVFEQKLGEQELTLPDGLKPKLVKTIGDELLLQVEITNASDAVQLVRFFALALPHYTKHNLADQKLLLKGAAWIAGFPINNHRVPFEELKPPQEDFIGPSIDTGFRIAKLATPSKLIVSVDLALLLLSAVDALELYYDGAESLRGVLGGRPYPIIWHHVSGDKDNADAKLHRLELKLRKQDPQKKEEFKDFCAAYIEACDSIWLIKPYLKNDPMFKDAPTYHKLIMETWDKVDARNDDPGTEPDKKMSKQKLSTKPPASRARVAAKGPPRKRSSR